MSIRTLDMHTQFFSVSLQNKHKYGEVNTDYALIYKILALIPIHKFKDPTLKWLDPCCGSGYFSIVLYKLLFKYLPFDEDKKHNHIITNMIYMIEINPEHYPTLVTIFGENANINCGNFLDTAGLYDMIIGNPPFNCNGQVKVPTGKSNKKKDGSSIWQQFVKKSMLSLKPKGHLTFITPSIWMKADHPMHQYMRNYNIKIHTMTNTETNKAFHGHAQTPTCYFTMVKKQKQITVYDKSIGKYVKCKGASIPLFAQSVIQKLLPLVQEHGPLKVIKTSMRPDYKGLSVKKIQCKSHPFPNISTCILDKLQPKLVINYSNKECVHANQPKLVLAHKMYGFPYYDASGTYGISNRDNYVILNKTPQEFMKLQQFLSTKFALYLFEATRYRMKYLEKYVFQMIPDITVIPDFPTNDETLAQYFKLSDIEIKAIQNHTKDYNIN